jgi:hypothetical protein
MIDEKAAHAVMFAGLSVLVERDVTDIPDDASGWVFVVTDEPSHGKQPQHFDLWVTKTPLGPMAALTISPPEGGDRRIREALHDRAESTINGRCPKCNGVMTPGTTTMWHESWCHAGSDRLQRKVQREGGWEEIYDPS